MSMSLTKNQTLMLEWSTSKDHNSPLSPKKSINALNALERKGLIDINEAGDISLTLQGGLHLQRASRTWGLESDAATTGAA